MSVRLWCLRHAESENVTGRIAGAVPSAALTERGVEQADAAAAMVAGEPIARVYASTALRARQTAAPLAARAGVDVVTADGLVEMGIGEYEGTGDPAVHGLTADVLRSWVVDGELGRRVGNGESGREVVDRMTAVFRRIAEGHGGQTVAVVGHVASLTVALCHLCGLGARVWGAPLPHAQPFLVEFDGAAWRCESWPDVIGSPANS